MTPPETGDTPGGPSLEMGNVGGGGGITMKYFEVWVRRYTRELRVGGRAGEVSRVSFILQRFSLQEQGVSALSDENPRAERQKEMDLLIKLR